MVADLEMNYCFGRIVAGTFGRSIWESPFATSSRFAVTELREDATWGYRLFRSDLIVKKGTTLTLQGEIRFATGAKIVVERNARLILDGARLAALCGEPWKGIEVEEDLNFLQRLFGVESGRVEMRNGAIIEHIEK